MLLGTDVCVRMVFVWEETRVPRGNPPVWLGDRMTISHADARYQTLVAAVRGECVNTAPARQLVWVSLTCIICSKLCTSIRVVKRQVLLSLKCNNTYDRETDKNLKELGFYPVRPWTLDVLGICFYLLGIWHYHIRIQLKCSLSFSCSCLMGKIFPPNYQTRPFLNLRKKPDTTFGMT